MNRLIPANLVRVSLIGAATIVTTGGAGNDMLAVLIGLAAIAVAAIVGSAVARRLGQSAVLGELVAGIALGNLDIVGVNGVDAIASNSYIDILAQLGVILLLFEVGLESTVGQMLKTGTSALLVATIGVVVPMALGWLGSSLLLPELTWRTHIFVGATLTATSVGITARVLKDLGRSTSREARIILGAAVIDDVMGLIVLSVVTGAVMASGTAGGFGVADSVRMFVQAALFLVGSVLLGTFIAPKLFSFTARMRSTSLLFAISLGLCLLLSFTATLIHLAPIVGAFAAGLILEDVHYRDFGKDGPAEKELEKLIHPIIALLAPIFFVTMGMQTDLRDFADTRVLLIAGLLLLVAVAGKLAAMIGVVGKGIDRLTVGVGMIPRGEVGLIFANIGLALVAPDSAQVLPRELFSALVIVIVITTLLAPPLLRRTTAAFDNRRGLE